MTHRIASWTLAAALVTTASLVGAPRQSAAPQPSASAERQLEAAIHREQVLGDVKGAIEQYKALAKGANRSVAAQALVRLGECYEKLGESQIKEARAAYDRVLREFGDQGEVVQRARARLAAQAGAPVQARRTALALKQLWAGPDVDLEGGVSPDGRSLAFIDWSTGDLAVRDLAKGESRRLTKNGSPSYQEYADFATFSPDGKQVAYGWCCNADGNYELRAAGIDGGEPRVIHRSADVTYFMPQGWSRDGRQILSLVNVKKDYGIALVSATNGSIQVLKPVGRRFPYASLSPDGRWIAFDYASDADLARRDVYLLATDRSREVRLVDHAADDSLPVWTPDGKHILFVSDRAGTHGLWRIPVLDGQAQGAPQLVKPDIGRVRPFGIAADGSLYYGLTAGTGEVYEADLNPRTGRLVSSPVPAMKRFLGFNAAPDYSPDGRFLACLSSRGQPRGRVLVIRSLGTGEEREFYVNWPFDFELKWSPDSRSILLPGQDEGGFSLFVIDAKTGEKTRLGVFGMTNNTEGTLKGWFPDGQSLYFITSAPADQDGRGRRRLVRYGLTSKQTQDIFVYRPGEGGLRCVILSPDATHFAFWRRDGKTGRSSLQVLPVGGSEPRALFTTAGDAVGLPGGSPTGLSWAPGGGHLFFAAATAAGSRQRALWRIATSGGQPENLGPLPDSVYSVVVHPSGNRVAFSTVDRRQEVWAMEHFLPVSTR